MKAKVKTKYVNVLNRMMERTYEAMDTCTIHFMEGSLDYDDLHEILCGLRKELNTLSELRKYIASK